MENSLIKVKRHRGVRHAKYSNVESMVRKIAEQGGIQQDDHIEAIVSGNFIAGDLFEALLDGMNLKAQEIIITTLSLSKENVDSLQNVLKYFRTPDCRVGLIVSDFFFSHERHKAGGIGYIEEMLATLGGFALAVAGIHTKTALIRTECGKHLVFGGSANLRSSLNIEHITITESKELYDFHAEWMIHILRNYRATGKFLRRDNLWEMLNGR